MWKSALKNINIDSKFVEKMALNYNDDANSGQDENREEEVFSD